MAKFVKRPVVIDAVQYTGDNLPDVMQFSEGKCSYDNGILSVNTLEGKITASVKDWIIKGVQGEFYACKPDILSLIHI